MTRAALHRAAVERTVVHLRTRGSAVTVVQQRSGPDLIVNGHTVAVLVSHTSLAHRAIRTAKKVYRYRYKCCRWNLSVPGARRTGIDVWVLVWQRPGHQLRFVVPAARMRRKWNLEVTPLRKLLAGEHWLNPYGERWQVLDAARGS